MFTYNWKLEDLKKVKPNGFKVFSCFAGGGGSSMGYKMAGYDVIGCNEIDTRQMEIYKHNLKPKYSYLMDIREFRELEDLPKELFELDILDGSFPCTPFSTSNNSKKDITTVKKFREGQIKQRLDDLAIYTIKLINKLQPKVAILENVSGLMQEQYSEYVSAIYTEFNKAGYSVTHKLLDMSTMGVPQRRKRVFFLAIKNDLKFNKVDLFGDEPLLNLNFNEKEVKYGEIEEKNAKAGVGKVFPKAGYWWERTQPGEYFSSATMREIGKRSYLDYYKTDRDRVLPTITAHTEGGNSYNQDTKRTLTKKELIKAFTFPSDYDFAKENPKYVTGMSVPPLAMYRISKEIEKQWLIPNKGIK